MVLLNKEVNIAVKIEPKVKKATVTFTTQAREHATQAILVGDWDDWVSREMKKNMDGTFSVKVNIDLGKSYQFGYSIDGDWTPDEDLALVASPFGTNNSILDLTEVIAVPKSAPKKKTIIKKKPAVKSKPGRKSAK